MRVSGLTSRVDIPVGRRQLIALLLATTILLTGVVVTFGDTPRDGWFREAGESAGLDYETTDGATTMVGGAFVADYDRDGYPDVLVTGGDEPVLYHNAGGEFEPVESVPSVEPTIKSALWVDYDADGWEDLLLLPRIGRPILLENDDGAFRAVDGAPNVTLDVGMGATAADYDGDGCPDLFVYQAGDWRERVPARATDEQPQQGADNGEPNYLFDGDCASFERVTDAGIAGTRWSLAASFADLTGDGRPDIHVANDFNRDVIYRNRGDGSFERIELPDSNRHGMASATADVAGDDTLDLFVTNIEYDRPGTVRDVQGDLGVKNRGNNLFVHTEDRFTDRATALGIRKGGWGWSGTFADFDNDGDRDLVHATKDYLRESDDGGLTSVHTRPAFWERTEDGFVQRDAERLGFEHSNGRGLVVLDYDGDGDRDLLVADLDGRFKLHENTRAGGSSLVVDVERGPAVTALGAVVHVTTADGATFDRTVTAGSNFLSQSPRTAHIGLGGRTVERVRVVWPDGHEVVLEDVRSGERIVVSYDGTVEPLG